MALVANFSTSSLLTSTLYRLMVWTLSPITASQCAKIELLINYREREGHMNKLTVGLDIAKSVFHLVLMNRHGRVLKKKKLKRPQVMQFFAQLESAIVVMESCATSHYWCREIESLGHDTKAIAPQHVVAYRKGNKTDYNDAQAIAEAAQRADMRFVPVKSQQQQYIQLVHRIRERLITQRTALCNQIRGLLGEYGMTFPVGIAHLTKHLPAVIEDTDNDLSLLVREQFQDLLDELKTLNVRIKQVDKQINQIAQQSVVCQRLMSMTGIGPVIATVLYASIGMGEAFSSGRHLAAWCGLVPKQHSTGDTPRLLGISKRGNTYLRTQMINGARAALRHIGDKQDTVSRWCRACLTRMSFNKACVALANKMMRMAWAMLHYQQDYVPGHTNGSVV
jgi:transposase